MRMTQVGTLAQMMARPKSRKKFGQESSYPTATEGTISGSCKAGRHGSCTKLDCGCPVCNHAQRG